MIERVSSGSADTTDMIKLEFIQQSDLSKTGQYDSTSHQLSLQALTYSVSDATARMRCSTLIFMLMMRRYLFSSDPVKSPYLYLINWTTFLHLSSWSCLLFLSFNSSTRGSNFILLVSDLKLRSNSFFTTVYHSFCNHIIQIVIRNHIRVVCHIRLYFACLCRPQCCVGDIKGPV